MGTDVILTEGQVKFLDWVILSKTTTGEERDYIIRGKETGYVVDGHRRKTYQKFRRKYLLEYRDTLKERNRL